MNIAYIRRLTLTAMILLMPAAVGAQGFTMLSQMPPRYEIGDFEYIPPQGDGWRETESSPVHFRIVYAESVDEEKINTRAEFWAQAFEIDDPDKVPDAFRLALASFETRKAERGEGLIANSNIEYLEGTAGILMYTLVTRIGDKDVYEIFYVLLKPDKSAYVAAKLLTQDVDYDQQTYYRPFLLSLTTLKPTADDTPEKAATAEQDDAQATDDDAGQQAAGEAKAGADEEPADGED